MKRAFSIPLLAALLAAGCLTRSVSETVFEHDLTRVELRSQRKGSETLPKHFQHPLTISTARMAHILARIDIREGGEESERRAAIPLELLYVTADGMASAFAKAGPDQEIVVLAVERDRRFGIFERRRLTSLIAWVRDDLLELHLVHAGYEIPNKLETKLPEPRAGEQVMAFRVVPAQGMTLVGEQGLAVAWRDPVFQRPSRTRILRTGKITRREILMESPEPVAGPPPAAGALPAGLAPDTLRRLADLEESKKRGEITQVHYDLRREEILRADPAYLP
jgi:hypothetical protein